MIGVLGGMGPMATADFLAKLVQATPAKCDFDHLPVTVQSIPQVPDRTSAILNDGPSPLPKLISMTNQLKLAGADFAVMACNTAHHWYDDLVAATNMEFIHIADAVCDELKSREGKVDVVGLMATPGTIESGFYQQKLTQAGIEHRIPSLQALKRIYLGIDAVKANDLAKGLELISSEVKELQRQHVRTIILGCTELPLILSDPKLYVDSNLALAKACVARSMSGNLHRVSQVA